MQSGFFKVAVIVLVMAVLVVTQASAKGVDEQAKAAATEVVTLKSIYPGEEPVGTAAVLAEVNRKMGGDIGVNLKLTWAPWDQYITKVELAVAAGEQIDFFWSGSNEMATYAAKKLIVPIDAQLAKFGAQLYSAVDRSLFDTMKIDGKVMGFPSGGNTPKRDVYQVLLYRDDLRMKYKMPALTSIENIEQFFEAIRKNEPGMSPIACKSTAYRIMKAFGSGGFLGGTNGAVGAEIVGTTAARAYAIQDLPAYKAALQKAREWYVKGYQPRDLLNVADETALLKAGTAAVVSGSAMTAAENQGTISKALPGAILADAVLEKPGLTKYVSGNGGNAMYLTPVTKNPDQVVKFWAWVQANQENYDLYVFGIKGKNYEVKNGRIQYLNTEYSDFPGWMFKNLTYYRFPEGVSDEYIETIRNWDKGAVPSPIANFVFNPKDVSAELAAFSAVWGQYSDAMSAGTLDLDANLPDIVARFKAAGQDKIVKEAQKQLDAFFAGK